MLWARPVLETAGPLVFSAKSMGVDISLKKTCIQIKKRQSFNTCYKLYQIQDNVELWMLILFYF